MSKITLVARFLRRLVLLGAPLLLAGVLLKHPPNPAAAVDWWLTLHVILLPLFGLGALAVYLLIEGINGLAATVSRLAIGVFVVVYSAYDTLFGLAKGILTRHGVALPAEQQATVQQAIEAISGSRIGNVIAVVGSAGWTVGVLAAAIALSRPSKPRLSISVLMIAAVLLCFPYGHSMRTLGVMVAVMAAAIALFQAHGHRLPLLLLVLAAVFLHFDHLPPFGPLAFGCFLLATAWLEFAQRPRTHPVSSTDFLPRQNKPG